MMRAAAYLIAALGLLALPGIALCGTRDDAARDLAEIEFEGIESFDVESVRRALSTDVDMQAASHPRVAIAEYLKTLEKRLREGYRFAGYLRVKVRVRHDEATGRITARIQEGKLYRCGAVEVTGLELDESEALKAALTEPFPSWDAVPVTITAADGAPQTIWETSQGESATVHGPLWATGTPAQWGVEGWSDVWRRISQHLTTRRRNKADFTCDALPNDDDETSRLVVKIKELGPASTVAEIIIEGARRNTPEEIKDFLGLRERTEVSVRHSALWEHRLWSSGRFISAYVRVRKAKSAPDDRSRWDVHVYLQEQPDVPLLRETLSPEDKLLLKARDWLARQGEIKPEEDVIVDVKWSPQGSFLTRWFQRKIDVRARLISGTSRGQIVSWSISHGAGQPKFSETLILRDPRITLFAPERSTRFEFDRPQIGNLSPRLRTFACDPEQVKASESKFGYSFGLLGKISSKPGAHLESRIDIDPVVALAWPRAQGCKISRHDGRLVLSSKTVHAEFDEQTGRIVELRFDDKKAGLSLLVRTDPGAVAAELQRQDKLMTTSLNVFDPERPVHTGALFLASEFSRLADAELSAWNRKRAAALRKLLSLWVPEPIGEVVHPLLPDADPRTFRIPRPDGGQRGEGLKFMFLALSGYLVPAYDAAAPSAASWLLGHDALLTAVAHRSGLIDLQSANKACGPIAHLAAASALQEIEPAQAALLAQSGLEHLSTAEFRREYAPLLRQHTWLGRNILSLGAAVRQLEYGEILALNRFRPKQLPKWGIADSLHELIRDPQQPLPDAVAAAFDRLWEKALRDWVAARLNEIIEKTRDAAPPSIDGSPIRQVSGEKP